jgi:urease accessory protein
MLRVRNNQIVISQNKKASCIGWDISQLGRTAQGETWDKAYLKNGIEYYFENELCWVESAVLSAKDDLYKSSCAIEQFPVFGTMWLCSESANEELVEELASHLEWNQQLRMGITRISLEHQSGLILIRGYRKR